MMKNMKMVVLALVVVVSVGGSAVAGPQTTCPLMGGKIDKKLHADHDGKRVYFCCPMCVSKFNKSPAKYIKKLEDQGVTLEKVQTTCPVSSKKIDKKFCVDHDGKRVYFCCPMCVAKFEKDPEQHIKKLEDQGITLERTPKPQTMCSLMGGKIDDKTCQAKSNDGSIKCTRKPGDQGIALEKTQTTCPLMGSKTDDKTCWAKSNDGSIKCTRKPGDQGIARKKPQTSCPLMGGKINKKIFADHDGKRVYFCCPMCVKKFEKDPAKHIKKLEDQGITLEKVPGEHHKGMSRRGSESK